MTRERNGDIMEYINDKDIMKNGINWKETVNVVEQAVICLSNNDYVQPIKPYLRYKNSENRIIAMPAFLGGDFNIAGIKWIASFPDNINKGIPRAHCVVILNEADSGIPICVFDSTMVSVIRTASVSGVILKRFVLSRNKKINSYIVGIIGWGPIGQNHLKMCDALIGQNVQEYRIYDIRNISLDSIPEYIKDKVKTVLNWQDAYKECDIVMTCTVSKERYIDEKPKCGALLLNISLRDYKPTVYKYVHKGIIVDDWDEVCRENTDIECFYRQNGLRKDDTKTLVDIVCRNVLDHVSNEENIMFNPMGMAVFDMAISKYYYTKIVKNK